MPTHGVLHTFIVLRQIRANRRCALPAQRQRQAGRLCVCDSSRLPVHCPIPPAGRGASLGGMQPPGIEGFDARAPSFSHVRHCITASPPSIHPSGLRQPPARSPVAAPQPLARSTPPTPVLFTAQLVAFPRRGRQHPRKNGAGTPPLGTRRVLKFAFRAIMRANVLGRRAKSANFHRRPSRRRRCSPRRAVPFGLGRRTVYYALGRPRERPH